MLAISRAVIGLMLLGLSSSTTVLADTLFLRAGTTLKVEALSCNAVACVATLLEGEVELRAADVLRIEPNENGEFDPDPVITTPTVSAENSAVDSSVPRTIEKMVVDAADRYALPRSLVLSVARAESGLDPIAHSPKGAQGVMQLMPGTARELGVKDAYDPGENIDAGTRLLRQLLERYGGRVAEALAAYNAGAGSVAKYKGVPPYRETRDYIRKVVRDFESGERPSAPALPQKK